MMKIWRFIHTACLFTSVVCWIGKFYNVSDVSRQYIEFCGANTLCSENNGEDEMIESMIEEEKFSTICPSCSCVKKCLILGNCCPDIALSTCIPTKHQIHDLNNYTDVFHNVVSRCPMENGVSEPKPCLFSFTLTNFQTQIPVTSTKTKISYASKTCAECHGENQISVSWSFDVSCPDIPIDPSVFSDFSELMLGMQERRCTVNLQPPSNYKAQSCNKETTIGKCNVTGLWDRRDEDLETACLNYWRPFGAFQNVFCFLCNIDAVLREQFSLKQKVNKTFSYVDENGELCDIQNENCIQRESHKSVTLTDAQIILTESFESKNGDYIANIDFLSSNLPTKMQEVILSRNISNTTSPDNTVDLKSLYLEYLSSGGYQNWCDEDHKKEKIYPALKGRRTCSCAPDCYLTMSCCPDAAYHHRWSCIRPTLGKTRQNASIQSVFLITRCPVGYEDEFVKSRCEESEDFDTLHIPVINIRDKKVYKNSYCFLCSDKTDVINQSIAYIKPWNVSLVCPHVFFPKFLKSMESIFDYAEQINCFINFKTSFQIDTCNVNPTINKCNVTGLATSISKNSIALCENPAMNIMTQSKNTVYRNIICDLCNSEFLEDPISQCNVTGNWIIDILDVRNGAEFYKRRCVSDVFDPMKYPFKNAYCKTCNFDTAPNKDKYIIHAGDYKTSYRQLFSILEVPRQDKAVSADSCNAEEMYDPYKRKCRKLRCSPGKFLLHGFCIPLINEVNTLQYALAFKTLITYELESLNGLYYLLYNFIEYLRLDNTLLVMDSLQTHFYVRKPCHFVRNPDLNSTTEALVYIEIKIGKLDEEKKLNRTDIENKLLNFTEWQTQIAGNSIQFEESVEAWYLPLRKRMTNSQTECVVHNYQTEKGVSVGSFHTFDVNRLLVCSQIELDSSEYEFGNNRLEVFLPEIERNFFVNEFIEIDNGTIQICVDSYSYIFISSETTTTLQTVLTIITLVVTILSLLCSFITFATYCTLPVLRTVPGKNIMCFSFSLFFAQLLFLVRSNISNKLGCVLVGSLTHYFWISVFVCTNVCCFHMFKLFVGSSLVHSDKSSEWKLICRYCGMSYVLPILPVVINIYFNHEQIDIDGNNFGYGGNKCFLVSSLALLLTFIAPIALQILFNIILFSITFHFIRNTPKVQSSQDRDDFSIFLKLFLLTGISWLFMVVDGFFEMSLFSFLVTFLNGSQGAFLFFSYICNKKVWIMLKKKFNKAPLQTTCKSESTYSRSNRDYKTNSNYSEVTVATDTLGVTQTSNDLNSI